MTPILLTLLVVLWISISAASEVEDPKSCEASFPIPERRELSLSSGRKLAYYTYDDNTKNEDAILYLNGFPGSGLESAVCAPHVTAKALVAIDRPGLGYTDPPLHDDDPSEDPFATCNSDVWELARHLGWKTVSVVGVSGGGPHALALMASYLSDSSNKPKLEKVALVGGVCTSAGSEGMMPVNQQILELVQSYETSWWSRLQLKFNFAIPHYLLPILPDSIVEGIVKSNQDLPPVDYTIFQENTVALQVMIDVLMTAVRQGYAGVVADCRRCFTPHHAHEKILQDKYGNNNNGDTLPQVTIYQGKEDTNVPLSHAEYMHQEIFRNQSKFVAYDGLGHISLFLQEAKTYIEEIEKSTSADPAQTHGSGQDAEDQDPVQTHDNGQDTTESEAGAGDSEEIEDTA